MPAPTSPDATNYSSNVAPKNSATGTNPDAPVPVAVIGAGRMGRHHARTYRKMPQSRLVAVVDADLDRAEALCEDYGGTPYADLDAMLAEHDGLVAATVATPTRHHADAARPLIERGIACLVEKPLAPSAHEARALAKLADRHHVTLQVGHSERYNPAVRALLDLGLTARYIDIDRVSPMSLRSMDVSVVMDVMIHDLDIVLALARSEVTAVDAVGIAVVTEHADTVSARVTFASGCVANLTASRLAMKTDRKLRLFSEGGYVTLDYQRRKGVVIPGNASNIELVERLRAMLAEGRDLASLDFTQMLDVRDLADDLSEDDPAADPLTAQLSDFLDAVVARRRPAVDGHAAAAAIDLAERITAAVREHRWPGVETPPDRPLQLLRRT